MSVRGQTVHYVRDGHDIPIELEYQHRFAWIGSGFPIKNLQGDLVFLVDMPGAAYTLVIGVGVSKSVQKVRHRRGMR